MLRSRKIGLIFIVLVLVGGWAAYKIWFYEIFVPEDFAKARGEGVIVAGRIVGLTTATLEGLTEISHYDTSKDYENALNLVREAVERNNQSRQEAIKLSNYLDQMAKQLSLIKPSKARELATEAIGQAVNMINRLLIHNDNLDKLLNLLEAKFEGQSIPNEEALVRAAIKLINDEAVAINRLNQQFDSTMKAFDAITLR